MITGTERLVRRRQMRTKRLQLAFKDSGWSKLKFQQQLQLWGVPGTSRANVDRYLSGDVSKPPVDFYIGAAHLLKVPLPWLLGVTDASTEEDVAAEEADKRKSMKKYWKGFDAELERGFPGYEFLTDATRLVVQSAWMAYDHYLTWAEDPPQHDYAGVQELGAAVHAPLLKLDIDRAKLTDWQLNRYVTTVCQAIAFLNLEYGFHMQASLKEMKRAHSL